MRALTEAEVRVLLALIGSGGEPQTAHLRRSEVPRSTFSTIRQRAFEEGWIYERAIPLSPSGVRRVVFALAHPFAESAAKLGRQWEVEPGSVLVWQSAEILFGVFLETDPAGTNRMFSKLEGSTDAHDIRVWDVPISVASLPVYFDYEGVWGHLGGHPSQLYPRSLGDALPKEEGKSLSPGMQQILGELLRRPYRNEMGEDSAHRFGPSGFPRSWRRLLARGYADWRVLPDLTKIPPFPKVEVTRLAFVQGELKPGSSVFNLFQDLVEKARVYPFLLAVEGTRVLVGAAGIREPTPAEHRTRGVLETLESHLGEIKIDTCELSGLRVRLDHRYERLFSPLVT